MKTMMELFVNSKFSTVLLPVKMNGELKIAQLMVISIVKTHILLVSVKVLGLVMMLK